MSYRRIDTQDGVTIMNKDLYDNLQDGIDEAKGTTLKFLEDIDFSTKVSFKENIVDFCNNNVILRNVELENSIIRRGLISVPETFHLSTKGSVILEDCEISSEDLVIFQFKDLDCLEIKNCKLKNICFHVTGVSHLDIHGNIFDTTVDNSVEFYDSKEYIHIANEDNIAGSFCISNNIFKNSKNDCIDVYPTGGGTVIRNNTFINCLHGIEIKSNITGIVGDQTDYRAIGIIVEGNIFRDFPEETICIHHFAINTVDDEDYSKYPVVLYSNNVFYNTLGVLYYGISFRNIQFAQVVNCRSVGGSTRNSMFIYITGVSASKVVISNCVSEDKFLFYTGTATRSEVIVSNCYGNIFVPAYITKIQNSDIAQLDIANILDSYKIFLNNVTIKNNLYCKRGFIIALGCFLTNVRNQYEDGVNHYSVFDSCILTSISASGEDFIVNNCKVIS